MILRIILLLMPIWAVAAEAPVNTGNAEHYRWGDCCDGWYLVKNDRLNVIQERLPAGAGETRHLHRKAQQFFYVLAGQATIEVGDRTVILKAGDGVHVAPGVAHRVRNLAKEPLSIMVTSEPPSHGDREEVGK